MCRGSWGCRHRNERDDANVEAPIRVAQVVGKLIAGGVESVVYNYYRHMDHQKVQFDIFYDADSTVPPPQDLIDMGARFYRIPPYQNLLAYIKTLRTCFRQNRYSIVHAHLNTLNLFPLYAAWRAGVPVRISHSHSTAGKGEWKNLLKYPLRPFAKIFPTHYCACSAYAGRWLFGNRFYDSGKVRLLRNAIDLRQFAYDRDTQNRVRAAFELSDKFVIGHAGRFCYQKNHEFLMRIFSEVYRQNSMARLLLAGDGELKQAVEEQAVALGLERAVLFLGVRRDVNELMQAMDVFVLPSRYEGLPVVGVEAQAAGLPCVLSNAMTRETCLLDTSIFMDLDQSPKQWAQAVLERQDMPRGDASGALRQAGFDIAREAGYLVEYYESLLSGQ